MYYTGLKYRATRPTTFYFFFNDTATTEIYTLSLHDALPIYHHHMQILRLLDQVGRALHQHGGVDADRKSTRLNSSHANISYAVFCLKKKNVRATVRISRPRCSTASCSVLI